MKLSFTCIRKAATLFDWKSRKGTSKFCRRITS